MPFITRTEAYISRLKDIVEQDTAGYMDTGASGMDAGAGADQASTIDPMLLAKLAKIYALLQSIKQLIEMKPIIGCRRRIYLLLLDIDDIYKYISDNKDNLADKFEKIVKVFTLIVNQLLQEVKACLTT